MNQLQNMKYCIVFALIVLVTGACAPLQKNFEPEKAPVNVDTLNRGSVAAMLAVEQARLGILDGLDTYPYSRLPSPDSFNVESTVAKDDFRIVRLAINEDVLLVGATHILDFYTLFEDTLGRRDIRRNRIIYRSGLPSKEEARTIASSLLSHARRVKQLKSRSLQQGFKNIVREYQENNGLDADGIIGRQTVGSLVATIEILDIDELSIKFAYVEQPRFEAYILKAGNGVHDVLNQGFESISVVRQNALSAADISEARMGTTFLVCIYFFDRVPPESGLKWGIFSESGGQSENLSDVYYPVPGTWPMIVGSFTLQDSIDISDINVSVFEDNAGLLGLDKKVGSYMIR